MNKIKLFILLILIAVPIYAAEPIPENYPQSCPPSGNGTEPQKPIIPFEDLKITCPVDGISETESCSVAAGEGPYTWELSCGTGKIDKDTGVILDIGDCCNGTVTVTGKSGTPVVTQVRAARGKWVYVDGGGGTTGPGYLCFIVQSQGVCAVESGETRMRYDMRYAGSGIFEICPGYINITGKCGTTSEGIVAVGVHWYKDEWQCQ